MYVRDLAGILALDAAFFQVVMAGVLGHALDVRFDTHIFQAVTAHVQDAYKNLVSYGKTASANSIDEYAASYPDIPLGGKAIFEQQRLLYQSLLEWLDKFES